MFISDRVHDVGSLGDKCARILSGHISNTPAQTSTSFCYNFISKYVFFLSSYCVNYYLGLPRRAAWWSALNPLLFVSVMSAPCSSSNDNMSSRFLEIASCKGVSPSESWNQCTHISHVLLLIEKLSQACLGSRYIRDAYSKLIPLRR